MTLKLCSMAARGLWVEMLAIMGISEKYGYLQIGGQPITVEQLAIMAACPVPECRKLLTELELNGVFSRDANNVPFSRRMVREHDAYERAAEYGKSGGNPLLTRSQKLESRSQKLESTDGLTPTLNPTLNPDTLGTTARHGYTLKECLAASEGMNIPAKTVMGFFHHYDGMAGWEKVRGNLKSALRSWQLKGESFGRKPKTDDAPAESDAESKARTERNLRKAMS